MAKKAEEYHPNDRVRWSELSPEENDEQVKIEIKGLNEARSWYNKDFGKAKRYAEVYTPLGENWGVRQEDGSVRFDFSGEKVNYSYDLKVVSSLRGFLEVEGAPERVKESLAGSLSFRTNREGKIVRIVQTANGGVHGEGWAKVLSGYVEVLKREKVKQS